MAYQCTYCKKTTLVKDESPCQVNCSQYSPREVMLIHHAVFDENKQRTLTCTGQRPPNGVRKVGSIFGVTCPRCLQTLTDRQKEKLAPKLEVKENTQSEVTTTTETESTDDVPTLKSIGFSDDVIEDIAAHAEKENLPELNSPSGLTDWIKAGNDVTIVKGIGPKTKIIVHEILGIE